MEAAKEKHHRESNSWERVKENTLGPDSFGVWKGKDHGGEQQLSCRELQSRAGQGISIPQAGRKNIMSASHLAKRHVRILNIWTVNTGPQGPSPHLPSFMRHRLRT